MLYRELLENLKGCPFCEGNHTEPLVMREHSYLTYSLAPYHPHHLLILPKRHIESLTELTDEEEAEIFNLGQIGIRALQKLGYESVSLLVREGNAKNKSICHIHFHLIPEIQIGSLNAKGEDRYVMTESDIEKIVQEIKAVL